MNTINPVRPYMTMKNDPQSPVTQPTQPQAPAFKGVIGQKVVQDITAKKAVTAAGILAMVGGMIGLSKEKVSDVMEELVGTVKGLMGKNEELEKQNLELKKTLINTKSEKDLLQRQVNYNEDVITTYTNEIAQKNDIITEKDAKIAELQKYEAMAKVKSVEEIDTILPEQFLELLQEAKDAEPEAEASLLNYMLNGVGQEKFLEQLERSNKILKAREDRITNIQEMQEAYENLKLPLGYSSVNVVQTLAEHVLKNNEQGAMVNYPPVKKVIIDNLEALTQPMKKDDYYYKSTAEIIKQVEDYYANLELNKSAILKEGYQFVGRKVNKNGRPYYSFYHNQENKKYDIYLGDLACNPPSRGNARTTTADGTVYTNAGDGYWD